jgi:hypothetical protein
MKSLFKLVSIIVTGSLLFTACRSENKSGKLVPKDAALVIHVDGKSLSSKLSWDEIKQTNWFKELSTDTSLQGVQREFMQDPAVTGMDIKADAVFFIQMNPSGPGTFVGQGNIADKAKFEAYYKKAFPGTSVTKQGDINFATLKDDAVMAWKDDKFMFLGNMPDPAANQFQGMGMDTTPAVPAAGNAQRLIEAGKKIFALDSDNSLAKEEKFNDLLEEKGDVHVYYNVELMMKAAPNAGMMAMVNMDKFIKGSISTYTVNFDQGKIIVKSKFYPSKDLAAIFDKYDGGKIDETMIKSLPSSNIAGIVAFSFKPEGVQEFIKLTGLDGMLNMVMAQAGVTLDDFIKANKGNMLLAVSDLNFTKDTTTDMSGFGNDSLGGTKKSKQADVLFAVSIGDKAAFEKLIAAGKKLNEGKPSDNMTYNSNEKYFAMGSNPEAVRKFLAGGNSAPAFWERIKNSGFGMFVDLQYIMKSMQGNVTDSSGRVILNESIRIWESIYSIGDGFDDGAMASTTEINMLDKSTNSLKTLNQYFDRISAVFIQEAKKRQQTNVITDSLYIPSDTPVTAPVPVP